ncbi:MAG: Chromatin structure-remodeling complex protein rsc9 [Chrysothrix sp. TS-e1954]|nr:MAG: Chromatin structure-remodeling complex protein rsc9 [Chrysothrix sp. TS-e1954]
MAPSSRAPSIEPRPEYDEFIAKVQKFHLQRGTEFEPAPRVGNHRVDLLRLYERVTSEGGYDAVSDTRANKLAWRKLGEEFRLGSQIPTLAFTLKTAYYKNLVAYEIKNLHNEEPPPKEIVEEQSARGGDVRKRTLDNYERPPKREVIPVNGFEDDSGNEKTSKQEGIETDEHGGLGARSSRGNLREAPPQRQIFQSDLSAARATRNLGQYTTNAVSNSLQTLTPSVPTMSNGNTSISDALRDYEPKPPIPMALKPVSTPATHPDAFKPDPSHNSDRKSFIRVQQPGRAGIPPGCGSTGPSIYMRTLFSLKSGILDEQEFALHHLVKISFERGDKYRFANFPGMAEALMTKVFEIETLMNVEKKKSASINGYHTDASGNVAHSDVNRFANPKKRKLSDRIEPEEFSRRLQQVKEAGLTFRNLIIQEENADYVSNYPECRRMLVVLLSLPDSSQTTELKHHGVEIAEQMTRYYPPSDNQDLFRALLRHVESDDRGMLLVAVRAICRFGSALQPQQTARLNAVPTSVIRMLCNYLLVEDEELRIAGLDFIYQFTAVPENVDRMLHEVEVESHIKQLTRLLMYCAKPNNERDAPRPVTQQPKPAPSEPQSQEVVIPKIPQDLVDQLLGFDEPERSSQWLKSCFHESPEGDITQIALWQAYQKALGAYELQRPMLAAKDFITNVSTTFNGAQAQVIHQPAPRFIIKGIKARMIPVNTKGNPYMRCLWHLEDDKECSEFAAQPITMWEHIVSTHLNASKDVNGKWDITKADARRYSCKWADCKRFETAANKADAFTVGVHMKTHLPDASERAHLRKKHNRNEPLADRQQQAPAKSSSWQSLTTMADDRGDATGLPLLSVLVLRNLARNIPKTSTGMKKARNGDDQESLVSRLFLPVREQLYHAMTHNASLNRYLPDLIRDVEVRKEAVVDTAVGDGEHTMPAFGTAY